MRILTALILVLVLSACATTDTGISTPNATEPDLPAVAVFYKDLSEELREDCEAFRNQSMLHYCSGDHYDMGAFTEALRGSGRFEQVTLGRSSADYQVLISSSQKTQDDAEGFANAVVSGASLMLIPMDHEMLINAEFTLLWRGEVIDTFSHEFTANQPISLFMKYETNPEFIGRTLAERFMQDVNQHQPFTPERLSEALQATDYQALNLPETLENYRVTGRHQYRDPLLGMMVSYNHQQFAFDRIDVFVYPIRSTDWSDTRKTLEEELDSVRAEIEYMDSEGYLTGVKLSASQIARWTVDQTTAPVGFLDGYYGNMQGERYYTSTYVFIQQDKFVKIRASFPITEEDATLVAPDDFARALLTSVSAPAESHYMARIREAYRESLITH